MHSLTCSGPLPRSLASTRSCGPLFHGRVRSIDGRRLPPPARVVCVCARAGTVMSSSRGCGCASGHRLRLTWKRRASLFHGVFARHSWQFELRHNPIGCWWTHCALPRLFRSVGPSRLKRERPTGARTVYGVFARHPWQSELRHKPYLTRRDIETSAMQKLREAASRLAARSHIVCPACPAHRPAAATRCRRPAAATRVAHTLRTAVPCPATDVAHMQAHARRGVRVYHSPRAIADGEVFPVYHRLPLAAMCFPFLNTATTANAFSPM